MEDQRPKPPPILGQSLAAALGDDNMNAPRNGKDWPESRMEEDDGRPQAASAPSPSQDSPRASEMQDDSGAGGANAGDIYKTVEKWEKAFWYVIFANHERALGSSAMRIHHKNSSAALMRQLAYTTFKSLVKDLVFFGQRKFRYLALGFHRTDTFQELMEKAAKEIQLADGQAAAVAMKDWMKDQPECAKFLKDGSAPDSGIDASEYICTLKNGQPKPLALSVGICSCIRSTIADHVAHVPAALRLDGVHGLSTLNDLGMSVTEALASQLPEFMVPVQHCLMLAVEYATTDRQKGMALLLWRKCDGEWDVALPPGLTVQPGMIDKSGHSPFILTGMMIEGSKLQVCLRRLEERVPTPHLLHDRASALLTVLMAGDNGAGANPAARGNPRMMSTYSSEEVDMASLLTSMGRPASDDREDRFLHSIEALCGSKDFRSRKIGYLPVHWLALFDIVMSRGGYERVTYGRRGEWAHIARQLYGHAAAQPLFAALLRHHYSQVLLPYERQIADDRDAHAIYASIAEDDGRDDAMDVDTGYGMGFPSPMADISIPSLIGSPLTLSHQMQEVLKAWMLQASERQDAIRAMGKNPGYAEIDAVKEVMEELVKRRDEGAEKEIKSMLVYGNPGIGKTTLIECLLRLGEAPQEVYAHLVHGYEEDLEAIQRVKSQVKGTAADTSSPDELPSFIQRVEPDPDECTRIQARAAAEMDTHEAMRKYCEGDMTIIEGNAPFLFPESGMDVSTCIKVRHGRRYHLLLLYEDEAEVRRQLECFDWKHMAEASKTAMSAEDKADFDYHKRLYGAVCAPPAVKPAAAAAAPKPEQPPSEGGEEVEDDGPSWLCQVVDIKGGAGGDGSAGGAAGMLAGNGVPSSNLVRGDMRLSESAKATLGKAFVYVGTGASVTDDRVYIKEVLRRKLSEPEAVCLKEVVIFTPCLLLEGDIELVDCPSGAAGDLTIKHRNLSETLDSADHILIMLNKDLDTAWTNTTQPLIKHGVFRRRLGLTPGAKPVQLSFLVCSEKDEKLSGMDVLKDDWARPFVQTFKEASSTVFRFLNQLLKDTWKEAGKDPSRLTLDTANVMTWCYPLLFTSLMLNAGFRQKHAKDIATMLERTQGPDLLSVVTQQSQAIMEKQFEDLRTYLQAKAGQLQEGGKEVAKVLPKEIRQKAQHAWQQKGPGKLSESNAVKALTGLASDTGSLSPVYDHAMHVLATTLNDRLDVMLARLERHMSEAVASDEGSAAEKEAAAILSITKVFEAAMRGRTQSLPWLSVLADEVLSEEVVSAAEAVSSTVKEQVKDFKESLVKEFKESMEKALVPSEEAATAEGKAALADRLAWFEQVRLQEEVERWLRVLPEWAEKEEALMAKVKDSLTELALELLPEVVPQADTVEQVKKHLTGQFAKLKEQLRDNITSSLKAEWAKQWAKLREEVEGPFGGLSRVRQAFLKGVATNQAPTNPATASLINPLLPRALDLLDQYTKWLKARRSGRAVELSRQLLERLSPAHQFLAQLRASAADVAMPPVEGIELFTGPVPATYAQLVTFMQDSKPDGHLSALMAQHGYHTLPCSNSRVARASQVQLLLALAHIVQVHHSAGGEGEQADVRMADAMLRVLSAQVRDGCLTPLRKSKLAERMGGGQLTYDALMDMTVSRNAWSSVRDTGGAAANKMHFYGELALIEAMSGRCGMPVDIYLEADGKLWRFRLCEDGKTMEGSARALRLAYTTGTWLVVERIPPEPVGRKRPPPAEANQYYGDSGGGDDEYYPYGDDGDSVGGGRRSSAGAQARKRPRQTNTSSTAKKPFKLSRLRPYAIVGMMRELGDVGKVWAQSLKRLDPTLRSLDLDNPESLGRVVEIVSGLCREQDVKGFKKEQLIDLLKRRDLAGCTKPLFPTRDFMVVHLNMATAKYISIGSGLMSVIAMAVQCPIREILSRENVIKYYSKLNERGVSQSIVCPGFNRDQPDVDQG